MSGNRRKLSSRGLVALIPLLALAVLQSGYVVKRLSNMATTGLARTGQPVTVRIWTGFNRSHPSITSGSEPRKIIRLALERWARVSSLSLILGDDTPIQRSGRDGINLVTFAESPEDRRAVGDLALAISKTWEEHGRVVDSDILFNPRYSWSTDEARGDFNLLQTMTHEFGHSLGLGHTINRNATMYFTGGRFEYDMNQLQWDDVAGINALSRMTGLDRITGGIHGQVAKAGRPVFGAFVVALNSRGVLTASALTLPDGRYRIDHLPPGKYTLYVEPLDGPMEPLHASMGALNAAAIDTNFLPRFYRNDSGLPVTVSAGESARADFQVQSGQTRLNPGYLRVDSDPFDTGVFHVYAALAQKERILHLGIAGDGAGLLSDQGGIDLLTPEIETGPVSRSHRNSGGIDFRWFPIQPAPETAEGAYSVLLKGRSGQMGIMTGGLELWSIFRYQQSFAHSAQNSQLRSEVFLVNRAEHSARARIEVRTSDGERIQPALIDDSDRPADAEFTIAGRGSMWLRGDPSRPYWLGSLQVRANRPLAATLLIDSPTGSTGLATSQPLYSFVTPVEVAGGGLEVNTGLALANFEPLAVQVYLELRDEQGIPRESTVASLAGHGRASLYASELFTQASAEFSGTLSATANRAIGAALIRTTPGVFTTLPVIENPVRRTMRFAQFAHHQGLASELWLVNPSPLHVADNVVVKIRDGNGMPAEVQLNGTKTTGGTVTVRLPPRGLARLRSTGGDVDGWVEVESRLPLGGVLLYESERWGTAGVGESVPERSLVAAVDQVAGRRMTGLALVNVQRRRVGVRLAVRDFDGQLVADDQITLEAHQRVSGFVNRAFFPGQLPDSFRGSLWVEADSEVAMTLLRQTPGVLTTFPSFPLHDAFAPHN